MTLSVTLPEDLVYDLDLRVNAGEFASRDEAAAHFIRRGLAFGAPRDPRRGPPPYPQPRDLPDDARPIQVDPTDVTWAPREGD